MYGFGSDKEEWTANAPKFAHVYIITERDETVMY